MSRLRRSTGTQVALSLTALEEASHTRHAEADLEHLFLAVLLSEQPAGRTLRSLGIGLGGAREAIDRLQQGSLSAAESEGAQDATPQENRTSDQKTYPRRLTERAGKTMKESMSGRKTGDAEAVLRELMVEPSGLILQLLQTLGTTPEQVRDSLEVTDNTRVPRAARRSGKREMAESRTLFIPTSAEEVWDFLSDPHHMPEWDTTVASIAVHDGEIHTRGTTEKAQRRVIRVRRAERPSLLEWVHTTPDRAEGIPEIRSAELFDVVGGADLRLTVSWQRRTTGAMRMLTAPLIPVFFRPLVRTVAHTHVTGISRQFRNRL